MGERRRSTLRVGRGSGRIRPGPASFPRHPEEVVMPRARLHELGPGGGFQGGVILAASFILLALGFGMRSITERFSTIPRYEANFPNIKNVISSSK